MIVRRALSRTLERANCWSSVSAMSCRRCSYEAMSRSGYSCCAATRAARASGTSSAGPAETVRKASSVCSTVIEAGLPRRPGPRGHEALETDDLQRNDGQEDDDA